jgi:hypothetical protein
MFIYIDESGTFAYPKSMRHSYACAGALTISERRHRAVLKSFKSLKRTWGIGMSEAKGRDLAEREIAQVIEMLVENNVKFHACATDVLYHPPAVLMSRKIIQASRLLANVTPKHQPELILELEEIGETIRTMSDQLFLQFCVMIELVNSHLHDMMLYFAKDDPMALGNFRWVVDRKGKDVTTYENTWKILLSPFIHGRQFSSDFESRIVFLEGGNYDHCQRFFKRIDNWPDHLPVRVTGLDQKTGIDIVDISLVLGESFTFSDSAETLGLQLADIVTNALRRAMMGNLRQEGWVDLGRLMFRWKDKCVRLVRFCDDTQPSIPLDDDNCIKAIRLITQRAGYVI